MSSLGVSSVGGAELLLLPFALDALEAVLGHELQLRAECFYLLPEAGV